MHYNIFKPFVGSEYPQVQKMSPSYNYNSENSVYALSSCEGLPDFQPDLNYFVVHNKAKLTDLLSVSVANGGFLISEKLKNIFVEFNLPPHHFYPAQVQHKKKLHNYYWFHVASDFTDVVNYEASDFFIYYNYAHKMGNIAITSKDDFIIKKKKIKTDNPEKTITIWAEKIVFSNLFDTTIDLFQISMFDSNTYISPGLTKAIVDSNLTGVEITQTTNLILPFTD
jgi:hypothetical protein